MTQPFSTEKNSCRILIQNSSQFFELTCFCPCFLKFGYHSNINDNYIATISWKICKKSCSYDWHFSLSSKTILIHEKIMWSPEIFHFLLGWIKLGRAKSEIGVGRSKMMEIHFNACLLIVELERMEENKQKEKIILSTSREVEWRKRIIVIIIWQAEISLKTMMLMTLKKNSIIILINKMMIKLQYKLM